MLGVSIYLLKWLGREANMVGQAMLVGTAAEYGEQTDTYKGRLNTIFVGIG